ncbi:MAG: sigma-70 family RNA polymerase sigma factor [Chitinophagaceae bacterium]
MIFPKLLFQKAEREIIERLLQNGIVKRKAEDDLFKMYTYFIREGSRKFSLSEDEAIDAYSDTILITIEKVCNFSFKAESSLKTYVYQIFHNKCVDLIRKKTTNKNSVHQTVSINDLLIQIPDAAKPIIQQMAEKSNWELIKSRLNEMGGNCRQLLLLFADGYSDKDIAITLSYKTADVVKTSRLRCVEKLRHLYKSGN